ncbi:MAG TPA: efflux RND transporter permease subunit, partial [Steroidobacteraceae bacterium]|nr:efflux RND transporter permease subunit [Steroidobacteraceae bacterium]
MTALEFPIRRYQFTLVAFLCLIALGWYAFANVPREEDPYFKIPGFFVTAIYPGADPRDLERLVAKPIEDRLAELDDVKKIETTITDGVSFTAIEFQARVDPDEAYDEVMREVNALRPTLPQEIAEIEIRKLSPGLVNTVQLALVSEEATWRELEDYARDLKDTLKPVTGIRTAESWAIPRRELRVQLDLKRMAEIGVTPAQVAQAIASENANIPAGTIDIGPRGFSLKTSGAYETLDEVRDTVVTAGGGHAVRIRDIAAVSWTTAPFSHVGRYDGRRAVFVTANQKEGYNILEVQQGIDAALDRFEAGLPQRITL